MATSRGHADRHRGSGHYDVATDIPQWTSQRPNRPPIDRPTPEITLWIMSPTPDSDDAVAGRGGLDPLGRPGGRVLIGSRASPVGTRTTSRVVALSRIPAGRGIVVGQTPARHPARRPPATPRAAAVRLATSCFRAVDAPAVDATAVVELVG